MAKSARSLEFDPAAFEDLAWWIEQDRKKALRIVKLIEAIQREPFQGLGEPEPLKYDLAGCWSRRINEEQSRNKRSRRLRPTLLWRLHLASSVSSVYCHR